MWSDASITGTVIDTWKHVGEADLSKQGGERSG